MKPLRVLIAEDSEDDAELLALELRRAGYQPSWRRIDNGPAMRAALEEPWDLILSDYSMPTFTAPEALALARRLAPDTPFLVISGTVSEETAVESMRAGARDYMAKGNLARLGAAVARELAEVARHREQQEAQQNLQEALLQSQKMEAIGRVAGSLAHDFNNVLTVIMSFTSSVMTTFSPGDPRRDDLNEVLRASDRAANLTQQLLTFSRKQPIHARLIDLNQIIHDIKALIRQTLGRSVELETRLDGTIPPITLDPNQFEQVLLNLAVNARDAMPDGGKLTIRTERAAEPDPLVGDHVVLEVADSGVGIPPEVQTEVFQPFFTTKPPGQGTGLGLSSVYGVIKQAGGDIRLTSEVDQGTTFTFLLPVR